MGSASEWAVQSRARAVESEGSEWAIQCEGSLRAIQCGSSRVCVCVQFSVEAALWAVQREGSRVWAVQFVGSEGRVRAA